MARGPPAHAWCLKAFCGSCLMLSDCLELSNFEFQTSSNCIQMAQTLECVVQMNQASNDAAMAELRLRLEAHQRMLARWEAKVARQLEKIVGLQKNVSRTFSTESAPATPYPGIPGKACHDYTRCRTVRHVHQLRCEWCSRYSHAQEIIPGMAPLWVLTLACGAMFSHPSCTPSGTACLHCIVDRNNVKCNLEKLQELAWHKLSTYDFSPCNSI